MRIRPHKDSIYESDLTPMIDMAFQLITFFMLAINFTDAEQDQRVTLPASELARPPDAPYEKPLTIHLTRGDHFIHAGKELTDLDQLRSELLRETQIITRHTDQKVGEVTVIIRADENAKTGLVQEVIQACQDLQFEKFALRGKQSERPTLGEM